MFKLSETQIELQTVDPEVDSVSTGELWNTLDSNFAKTLPYINETIEKWNSRTKLINNLGHATQSKKQQSSVFNATIVEQVNSLMENKES